MEEEDILDRYDTFDVRSYDGLRLNGSLVSYATVGSGGSVIEGRLIAVDASPSDDTMRLHIGSLVNSIVKRVNSDDVKDTVEYCMVVDMDDGLIGLAQSSKSPSIGNELNDILFV